MQLHAHLRQNDASVWSEGAGTMDYEQQPPDAPGSVVESAKQAADFGDLLQELRVLMQGAQILTAFLIILPFNVGFARIGAGEKGVYLATFACSLGSLIIFTAPAAQHRLEWPLRDRPQFKRFATRMAIVGLVPLSLSLVLATHLIVSQTLGTTQALLAALAASLLIGAVWWLVPLLLRRTI
jgi:hypothetical protein